MEKSDILIIGYEYPETRDHRPETRYQRLNIKDQVLLWFVVSCFIFLVCSLSLGDSNRGPEKKRIGSRYAIEIEFLLFV